MKTFRLISERITIMKSYNFIGQVLLLFMVAFTMTTCEAKISKVQNAEAKIDSLVAGWIDSTTPGGCIAVIKDGEIKFKKGYGLANVEYNIPNTPSTVFNIGSIDKQFTAFAIAMLADQGLISLQDDIRKYFPELPEFKSKITIQHLIDHTSGLRDYAQLIKLAGWLEQDELTREQIFNLVVNQKELNFLSGEEWDYSNTGYELLTRIVEIVTKKSFGEWTNENLFKPLEMSNTHFISDYRTIIKNLAHPYKLNANNEFILNNWQWGCYNLYTTVEDIAKWINNFESGKIGGESVLKKMNERGVLNNGEKTKYGFGQSFGEYKGLKTVTHSGGIASYISYLMRFPEQKFAVVVLCNGGWIDVLTISKKIVDIYLGDMLKSEQPEKKIEKEVAVTKPAYIDLAPEALKKYEGDFKLETGKLLSIVREGNHLALKNLSKTPFILFPVSETKFVAEGAKLETNFMVEPNGNISSIKIDMGIMKVTASRFTEIKLSKKELSAFIGNYYSDELKTIYTLKIKNDVLIGEHLRYPDTKLTPSTQNEFNGSNAWLRNVKFERTKENQITGFRLSPGYIKNGVWFEKIK